MQITVTYWTGEALVDRTGAWEEMPSSDVAYVTIEQGEYTHRLQGMDCYWVHGRCFGMFNLPENYSIYDGYQEVAYEWGDSECVALGAVPAPDGAHVLHGVMMPDDVAQMAGLL